MKKTHKVSGWTREPFGFGNWKITPTDDSGVRIVAPMGRCCWANLPNDDRARENEDRIVLVEGAPLPEWAVAWLEKVNHRQSEDGRERLRAAIDDADDAAFRDGGW
jgi:hypothetical protein